MSSQRSLSLLGCEIGLSGEDRILDRIFTELHGLGVPATGSSTSCAVQLLVPTAAETGVVLAELTRAAVDHSPLLCIHAGVVSAGHGSVVIPGISGLGKTTLTAALVQAGFGYLSDEVLALDRRDGAIAAFARPLALAADSWELLGLDPQLRPGPARERLAPVSLLGRFGAPAPVREILLARRRPGPPTLESVPRGSAVSALLGRSFNHFRDPAGSFHAVVELIRRTRVWTAGYQDAPELAELLAGLWLPGRAERPDTTAG